jgi:2-oxoisovalerate dehydrogenase E1 component beta subunit
METGWFEPLIDSDSEPHGRPTDRSTYLEAIRAALADELDGDEGVVLLGQDIGLMGGAFRVTEGLFEQFGPKRIIDTPLAETAIIGAAIGLAIIGMRPIAELQFADFISCAYDQLVTEAAKLYYRFGISVPIVVRAPSGGGVGAGPFHSQSPEGIFARIPGLKVACPGTVQDAYDLLRWAVADENPVIYFEHKGLYRTELGELQRRAPSGEDELKPIVRRQGRDVTVVTYGSMLRRCVASAEELAQEGIDMEVIDLRIISPRSLDPVFDSVAKTSRLVIVHEDTYSSGIGSEVAGQVAEHCIWDLDAPITRITAPDVPVPFSAPLEDAFIPATNRISDGIRMAVSY